MSYNSSYMQFTNIAISRPIIAIIQNYNYSALLLYKSYNSKVNVSVMIFIIVRLSCVMTRTIQKSPNFAVNWIIGDDTPEVVDASTGLRETNEISRLAKRELFSR